MEQSADTFLHLLLNDFESGFGLRMGKVVYECDLYSTALDLAAERQKLRLSAVDRAKVAFRAAYALEYAFFLNRELFISKYLDSFIETFPLTKNRSAHRHFGKMMTILLRSKCVIFSPEQASIIAETAAIWLADPKTRVAVQAWALEILTLLAPQVAWIAEVLPDAIGLLSLNPTPAMKVRLRRHSLPIGI